MDPYGHQMPQHPGKSQVKGPAIALIATAAVNFVVGALVLLSLIARLAGAGPQHAPFESDAERYGYYAGQGTAGVAGVLTLLVAPFVLYAGVQMLRGKGYSMARTASILALLPLTSCCCVLGVPVGIWALVVLKKPEVRAYFEGEAPRPF